MAELDYVLQDKGGTIKAFFTEGIARRLMTGINGRMVTLDFIGRGKLTVFMVSNDATFSHDDGVTELLVVAKKGDLIMLAPE